MPHKKILLIALIAWITSTGFGQTYVIQTIDFRDSINSKLVAPNTDNLAVLLIDGYLSGLLTGYKFTIGEQVLKRAPLSADQTPPLWNPKQDYFIDDQVSYKGLFFRLIREAERPVPAISDAWQKITLLGMPVSTRYFFPTVKDTLSRQDFIRAMVAIEPTLFSPWYKEYVYYASDVVEFNGRNYEAAIDNEGKSPGDNPNVWYLTNQGSLMLFSMQDFSSVNVLMQLQENKTPEPVMLSILVNDERLGVNRTFGLHFYFKDVIHYLNQVKQQPLLYVSETGYLGSSKIALDNNRRTALLNKLKEGLTSKKIRLGKKMIVSKTSLDEFLAEPAFSEPPMRWIFFQKPSGDFVLIDQSHTSDFRKFSNIVAIIPAAKLKSIFPVSAPRFYTYSEALTDTVLHVMPYDTLHYDTLEPVEVVRVKPIQPPQTFSWFESYTAGIDSADQKTQEKFLNNWSRLQQAFYRKQLRPKNPLRTFFPCRSGVSVNLEFYKRTYAFTPDYEFNHSNAFQDDSLAMPKWFTDYSVTYKKTVSQNTPDISYIPVEISFQFMVWSGAYHYPVSYTLRWDDVKNTLRDSLQATEFITGVEQATVNFSGSEVVYGVISN